MTSRHRASGCGPAPAAPATGRVIIASRGSVQKAKERTCAAGHRTYLHRSSTRAPAPSFIDSFRRVEAQEPGSKPGRRRQWPAAIGRSAYETKRDRPGPPPAGAARALGAALRRNFVMSLRFLTAGESHGQAITAIVDGVPAGLPLSPADIDAQLKRRQLGYGRGRRMQIEPDRIRILSGVRSGLALGSPIALQIENKDWAKWSNAMAVEPVSDADPESDWRLRPVTRPRPGHADLAGALKHGFDDVRNVLERASARETAMRVAAGAVARVLLGRFGVCIASHVVRLGPVAAEASESLKPEDFAGVDESPLRCLDPKASEAMVQAVDEAKAAGQTLGGVFEVIVWGVPPGLGSHTQWDRKLDGRIA